MEDRSPNSRPGLEYFPQGLVTELTSEGDGEHVAYVDGRERYEGEAKVADDGETLELSCD